MSVRMKPFLLAAMVAVFVLQPAQSAEPPLAITVSLSEGSVGNAGSPVAVSATLTNHSGKTLSASLWDYDDDYSIEVRDADGNSAPESEEVRNRRAELDACRNSGKSPCGRKILLHGVVNQFKPGESWQERLVVTKYFNLSRPGTYTIQLERKLPEELGKGTVKSNPITITLTE